VRPFSPWARVLRTPMGVVTTVLLAGLLVIAVIAPPLLQAQANHINPAAIDQGISASHLLGTDTLGRDILARTLVATRMSLGLALLTTLLGTLFGICFGSLPVVVGPRLGRLVVAAINLLFAFPGLLLAIFLAMIFGVGARGAVLALAVALAPWFARLTHATASGVAGADYVAAARMLGVSRWRILTRHVLPNIAEPLVVNATSQVGSTLLSLSALSYIGFGVQPPAYDWGRMLTDGLPNIYTDPAAALAPCVAVVIAGITFVFAGELLTQIVGGQTWIGPPRRTVFKRPALRTDRGAARPARELMPAGTPATVRVQNLAVEFPAAAGAFTPVADVSFSIAPGEIVGMVGESGSGKSLTAAAVSLLVPHPGACHATLHEISGADVTGMRPAERNRLLGTSLAMVFQDPMSALNPVIRVGLQLAEVAQVHLRVGRRQAMTQAVESLRAVRIPDPEVRARQYPREFSGGMRQRAAIGMGLVAEPALIIADEPTTALDVTVQREVLSLLRQLRDHRNVAVLFISHDIAVISEIASRVLVMYAGRIVEELPVTALAGGAAHPYTRALVASVPDMTTDRELPLATIPGRPPDPRKQWAGCAFAERCSFADETCRTTRPPLVSLEVDRQIACWHPQADPAVAPVGVGQ
jgi:peptide/nickel transport system permease protein